MPRYTVNPAAFDHAVRLIEARRYVLRSDWGERQPRAEDENRFLRTHSWDEYAEWHVHFRAAEWRHKAIELAAHDLLQVLDKKAGIA